MIQLVQQQEAATRSWRLQVKHGYDSYFRFSGGEKKFKKTAANLEAAG